MSIVRYTDGSQYAVYIDGALRTVGDETATNQAIFETLTIEDRYGSPWNYPNFNDLADVEKFEALDKARLAAEEARLRQEALNLLAKADEVNEQLRAVEDVTDNLENLFNKED